MKSIYPARLAVKVIFFLNGFAHANYYSRLPRLQEIYGLSDGTLGVVLLSTAIGAFLAMPFTGWLVMRHGSRRVGLFSVYMYCGLVPFIPLFPSSLPFLLTVFFLLGVSAGMLDVSMNAQAVMIEQKWGKPIMTSFHAFFSVGMMIGALTGSLFTEINADLPTHFAAITVLNVIVITIARFFILHDKPEKKVEGPAFTVPNAAMAGIGVIAFCSMLGEGAMADWSTIYMENFAHAAPSISPWGLAAFALAMTAGRIFGDAARIKFGDRKLMGVCGIISSLGLILAILIPHPIAVISGFFIVGIGLATIVPIAYSIAGNARDLPSSVALSMVTTVGYSGFMIGPPIIGMLADYITLRFALLVVLALFLLMTALAVNHKRV